MGFGFQAFNDQGTVQFDSEMPNLAFVQKGTGTTQDLSDGTGATASSWSIGQGSGLQPFDTIAIRCNTAATNGGFISTQLRTDFQIDFAGGVHNFTYYTFKAYTNYVSIPGAGMEAYDGNSKLTFSTAYRPLAVVGILPITNNYEGMSDFYSLDSSKDYAFIKYGSVYREYRSIITSGDISPYFTTSAIPAPRSVTGGIRIEEIKGSQAIDGTYRNGGYLIVDVTGI